MLFRRAPTGRPEVQQWFNLSDPGMEDALYDSESMRRFAGIDLAADLVPDETAILRFRHLLEQHQLTEGMFAEVRALLEEKKLLLKSVTIVDATIIAAPPSTKNAAQERDPQMKQTRKGKQWHFGMKLHVGTDRRGLVHSVVSGPASEGDITRLDELLHGQERELFGDQAYWSEDHRQHCRHRRAWPACSDEKRCDACASQSGLLRLRTRFFIALRSRSRCAARRRRRSSCR